MSEYVFGQPEASVPPASEPVFEQQRLHSLLLPLTAAGAVLFLWAAFLPLYRWYHRLTVLCLAAAAFLIVWFLSPAPTVSVPVTARLPRTGSRALDRSLKEGRGFLRAQLHYTRLMARTDPALADCLAQISGYSEQLLQWVARHPDAAPCLSPCLDCDFPALELILADWRCDVTDKAGRNADRAEAVRTFLPLIRARRDACLSCLAPDADPIAAPEAAFRALAERLEALPPENER